MRIGDRAQVIKCISDSHTGMIGRISAISPIDIEIEVDGRVCIATEYRLLDTQEGGDDMKYLIADLESEDTYGIYDSLDEAKEAYEELAAENDWERAELADTRIYVVSKAYEATKSTLKFKEVEL